MATTSQVKQHAAPVLPDYQFRDFLDKGQLMLQRSRSSGHYVFPPRIAEPGTGARDLEWVQISGQGVVYSVTVISRRNRSENYNVALVDLAEGPRLVSRVEGISPESVYIGMPVCARIIESGEGKVLVFVPVTHEETDFRGRS